MAFDGNITLAPITHSPPQGSNPKPGITKVENSQWFVPFQE
jgi:hypothetical protein